MKSLNPRPLLRALACALALPFFSTAQTTTVESLLEQPVSDLPSYDTLICKECIFLKVQYGTSDFLNLDVLKRFDGKNITQVDMVYTSFSRSKGFDQTALNRERLAQLQSVAAELFDNEVIKWTMLRQTNCNSLEESERLFHGFVVHLAPGKAVRDAAGKLAPAKPEPSNLPKKASKAKARPATRDTTIREMSVNMRENTKRECEYTGKYLPNDRAKARKGIRYDKKGKGRKPEKICKTISLGYTYDTSFYDRKYKVDVATGKLIDRSIDLDRRSDTTVIDAMDRNWEEWKKEKVVVVQDVTGSMSGYLTQILTWHELYAAKGVEHYVFFNDGDGKLDSKKQIGKTGGIYYVQSNRLADIQQAAQQAARAGGGGDNPENNVEAAIYAQAKCPDCTMMVMIADNYAPAKDFALVREVKKPVHIVVCGGNGEQVHSDYLSIAAITGGSVHTSKMDLDLKGKAVEGELLELGDRKYRFKNGRFDLAKD
jgi:hypothetical protein